MIESIIFDLEGVILDSEPLWSRTDKEFLKRHNVSYDEDQWKPRLMGKNLAEGAGMYKESYAFPEAVEVLAKERREIARELLGETFTFIPGFEEFFASIQKVFRVAIATSLERDFLAGLNQRFNLSAMFKDHIYSIDDISRISKPSPDIFLYTASSLGSQPEACVVVEDSPNGVEAAKRAGMRCIAITTTTSIDKLSQADQIVDSYDQINLEQL